MFRFALYDEKIEIPNWVTDLEAFRRWSDDNAFPENGQVSFLKGDIWVEMGKEQLFDHNQVKTELTRVLAGLVRAVRTGRYFADGAFLSNGEADVSNQPDGMFVSAASLQEGRVQVVEGRERGHVELEGTPDMVLEVVSDSSVEKDTVLLRRAYAEADVREYWLVDARKDQLRFDILRLTERRYTASRKRGGWLRSDVFDRWFRLTRQPGPDGFPEFTLEMQTERPNPIRGK